jgi:predicted RNA binding protein with dsRBD fold (UPF0201 family)
MFDKNLTKPKLTFLVNKEEALVDSGSFTNDTTGAINLAPLELGLINKSTAASDGGVKISLNEFVDGASATAYVPQIKIVQGTSASANPPADNRPGVKRSYESSAVIQADEKIWINVKKAKAATYSIVGVDNINVSDEVEYRFRVAFFGRYHDIMYSQGHVSTPVYSPYYNSPEYSQLITDSVLSGTGEALDHLVKNLVVEANKNSDAFGFPQINKGGQQLVLALALNKEGAATGTVTVDANNTTITSVTIGGVTMSQPANFAIGGSATITATNIRNTINNSTALDALGVKATSAAGVVTVTGPGAAGNAITLAVVGADLSVSGATLTGGFGTGLSALVPNVPVAIFAYNGPNSVVTKSYVFNAEEVASLKASYPGTTSIVVADISSIADVAQAEEIAFIGLDRPKFLAEDRLKESKVRIEVGLTSGFTTATTTTLSNAFEGFGYPEQVKTWYVETQERRDNDIQFRGIGLQKIQYPSDVLDITTPQDVVIITHSTTKQGAMANRDVNLQSTVVLTPADLDALDLPSGALGATTSDVPTAIETWARQNGAHIQVTYDA